MREKSVSTLWAPLRVGPWAEMIVQSSLAQRQYPCGRNSCVNYVGKFNKIDKKKIPCFNKALNIVFISILILQ